MSRVPYLLCLSIPTFLVVGCGPKVFVPRGDHTAPEIKLLCMDYDMTTAYYPASADRAEVRDETLPGSFARYEFVRSKGLLFLAGATDPQSGVQSVRVSGTVQMACGTRDFARNFLFGFYGNAVSPYYGAREGDEVLPTLLTGAAMPSPAEMSRTRCGGDSEIADFGDIEITVTATNHLGMESTKTYKGTIIAR